MEKRNKKEALCRIIRKIIPHTEKTRKLISGIVAISITADVIATDSAVIYFIGTGAPVLRTLVLMFFVGILMIAANVFIFALLTYSTYAIEEPEPESKKSKNKKENKYAVHD